MQILGPTILVLIISSFFFFIIKELIEINFLKKILESIIGKRKINSSDDLIKIKTFLNKNITYNPKVRDKKRPLLRHTASQILKSNYGFCGENSRVAIKLFQLGGVPARRIYLYGKKWQHVVIEYKMKDNLYLFDGHYDPETVLEDKDIGVILSEDISAYPNGYVENMYIDFCRIKIFYNFSPLRSISKMKLPTFIAYFFESPYLIKAFLALFFIMGICSYII